MFIDRKKELAELSSFSFIIVYWRMINMYKDRELTIKIKCVIDVHNLPFICARCPPIIRKRFMKKNGRNISSIYL